MRHQRGELEMEAPIEVTAVVIRMAPAIYGYGPSGVGGLPAFLQAADKALYRAKGRGRNQVCSSSGDPI